VLTLFDATQEVLDSFYQVITENLPTDIATFIIQILQESVAAVEDNRAVIIVVTVLIALWSGSRAVYAVQKALRLVADPDAEGSYVRMRATGIAVTVGAGVGVVLAYTLALLGSRISRVVSSWFPWISINFSALILTTLAFSWVFGLLYSVYRWGAPLSIRRPAGTALLVTTIIGIGTWAAMNLMPSGATASVAVFGTIGIILLWLYAVGIVVVGAPIAIGSLLSVLEAGRQR
jgi:membrane protein